MIENSHSRTGFSRNPILCKFGSNHALFKIKQHHNELCLFVLGKLRFPPASEHLAITCPSGKLLKKVNSIPALLASILSSYKTELKSYYGRVLLKKSEDHLHLIEFSQLSVFQIYRHFPLQILPELNNSNKQQDESHSKDLFTIKYKRFRFSSGLFRY